MRFSDPEFESEFWSLTATSTRKYSKNINLLLILLFSFWLGEDLLLGPASLTRTPHGIWITCACIIVIFVAHWQFTNTQWFLHFWAEWLTAFVFFICGVVLILQGYLVLSQFNFFF